MLDLKPEWIIHCAAFTNVEAAEDELKDVNWEVNVDGTENISEAAEIVGAKLVYISTDYVFDGTKKKHIYLMIKQIRLINMVLLN